MTRQKDLERLATLAAMTRDARLAVVAAKGRARNVSIGQLEALKLQPSGPGDLSIVAMAGAAALYDRWAEARRIEINRTLARQTAEWIEARDAARTAFGRAEVLARLAGGKR